MTKTILKLFVVSILLIRCSGQIGPENSASNEIIKNALIFEMSFGDKDLPDEYLLASPRAPGINSDNDIFVPDETRIKVFEKSGKPKMIIGGPGEGPGEFRSVSGGISFNDSGVMTVIGGSEYHIFSPEYNFVKIRRSLDRFSGSYNSSFTEKGYFVEEFMSVYTLDYDRQIHVLRGMKLYSVPPGKDFRIIVLDMPDSARVIVEYTRPEGIQTDRFGSIPYELGIITHDMLPGNRLVYTYFTANEPNNIRDSHYILRILDLDTGEESEISHFYNPHPITKPPTQFYENNLENPETDQETKQSYRKMIKNIEDRFADIPYYIPLQKIITDNNIIFAFTFVTGDSTEIFTDVFDGDTGDFLLSAYFPFIPDEIKNGYAYRRNDWRADNTFPQMEVYKINRSVYRN